MNNKMLSGLALLCAALLTQSADARGSSCNPCGAKREHRHHYCHDDKHPFFVTVGTGISWSAGDDVDVDHVTKAADASTTFWDGAKEGYDDDHGSSELYNVALGYHWNRWFSTFVELTHRPSYSYKKSQTLEATNGTNNNVAGLENLGDKTRYFDLKNTSITFNFDIRFSGFFDCCSWEIGDHIMITPVVGAGVGIAYNRIENFHSVATTAGSVRTLVGRAPQAANRADGTALVTAGTSAAAGTATDLATPALNSVVLNLEQPIAVHDVLARGENQAKSNMVHSIMLDRTKTDFVWQVRLGLAVAYKRVSFDVFYRYNDSGSFKTWNYTVDAPVNFLDPVKVPAWKGDMAAHELCFNCNKKF